MINKKSLQTDPNHLGKNECQKIKYVPAQM